MSDTVTSTVTRDNLISNQLPLLREYRTLTESQDLKRGSVLGIITANGEAKLLDGAAVDGSQTFDCVLLDDAVTGAAETKQVPVGVFGAFLTQGLIFGGVTTAADKKAEARTKGCHFLDSYADANAVGG